MSMCPGRNKKNWRRHLDRDIKGNSFYDRKRVLLMSCKEIQKQKIQTVVTLVQTEELVSMGIPNMLSELTKV